MRVELPAAVYGKDLGSPGKTPLPYHWQKKHRDFPDAAHALADKWCRRFQWTAAPGKLHPPVVMWVPVCEEATGALLLRFTDVGPDDRGRLSTLSLEAAWGSTESLALLPDFREYFLMQSTREQPFLNDSEEPSVHIQSDADISILRKSLSDVDSQVTVIASNSSHGFSVQDIDELLFLNASTWQQERPSTYLGASSKRIPAAKLPERKDKQGESIPPWTPRRAFPWGRVGVALSLLIVLASMAALSFKQRQQIDSLLRAHNVLNGKYTDAAKENEDISKQLNTVNALYTQAKVDIEQLNDQLTMISEQNKAMQKDIAAATRQEIQDLKETISSLLERLKKINQISSPIH